MGLVISLRTLNTIIASVRVEPEWFAGYMYVVQLWQQNQMQAIQDAGRLSRLIARNSEEIGQMYREAYESRQRSQDTIARRFSEAIRGVETYDDPVAGRPVELPGGYADVWVSANGEYVLSNDVNYNPNEHDTMTWQRVEPVP